jgi:V8-like Glu-specific endopeptidase
VASVKSLHIGKALIGGMLIAAMLLPAPALAVTYGNPVENPLETAPFVVSVWASETGDTRDAEFICSGTLISSNIILTAAHCTDFENFKFFVKIKTVALMQEAPFYAATPWTGTRYDPGSKVKPPEGDIGLLRINTNITGVNFPSLANALIGKKINSKTSLILMGWGYDQNKKLADTLRFSKVKLQDARSQRDWSGYFNIKTMISAGKYIKDEKKWSGSCNGDSGGPLLAKLGGLTYVVGVTSWGHKQCRTEIPSVFSRVSYYQRDIKAGINAVNLLANSVNRLAPVEVIAPTMKGEGTPGTSLFCNSGTWLNAVSVEINWMSPSRLVGNTNPEAKVIAADIGQEFKCRILAKSKSGNSETTVDRYLSKVLPKKLAVASPPVIGGLEGSQSIKAGAIARCENWNWAEPVDQEVIEWFSSTSSNPSTPVNGKLLGTGREIRLTQEILKSERGRYLVCQLTGTRAGFPSYLIAVKLISTADSPFINTVTVSAPSLKNGINASCSFSGTTNAERIQYEWGYSGAGNEFTALGGQNADFVRITPQILRQASGQKLACKVTVTNSGESISRIGTSFEVFESELDAPKPSISVSNTPYVGSSASCSIANASRYTSVAYSWGITTSPDSGNFVSGVLGNNRDLTFDARILVSSAGNYITCVVTVANEISKAQGIVSSKISITAAPSLPSMSAPYISNQTRVGSQINVSISIPSAFGFDQSTMEAKLRLPGSNCDGNTLNSFPNTIVCSGLAGNRDYSVYTEVRYSTNSQIPSRQSSIATFRTNDATAAPSISLSNATQSVNANSAISTVNVSNSGGASTNFSISPSLPSGLTFNSSNGSISGTPTQAQSQRSYTITATNSGGSSSATFTLTVVALVTDRDGPTISTGSTIYNSSTGIVTGTFELVDISGVASCRVTIFNSNNVDVASTTSCSRVSGTSTNGTWQVQIDMQNSAFNPGAYTMKVSATDTFGNTRAAQNIGAGFTKPGPSVSNLGSLPIPRTIGINYLDQIVLNSFDFSNIGAAPGSFTWTVRTTSASGVLASSIPIGSNQTYITGLSPSTTYNVVLVATDSAGGTKVSLPLTITTLAPAVAAPSISLFNATQSVNANSAISTVNVSNSGGASTNFSISPSLPSGLTFNSSNGSISGTPTQAQSQRSYTITATNSGGSSSATFTLTVVMATISSPVVVLNSGILTSGVSASGSVTAGQYFGISWRVTSNDAIYTQVSLIDSSGNSASTGTGALVSGTTQDGTYQASLLVPQVFSSGRYLICVYAVNSKDMRSASQCGGRIQHVQVAEVQVNGVLVISTVALNGVVIGQGRGGVWEIKTFDRSNNYVQGAVAKANNGAPDINAARIIKSAGNNDARYPDNWQATFEVNNSAPNGTVYTIHWTLRQGDGTTIVGIGGEFRVG